MNCSTVKTHNKGHIWKHNLKIDDHNGLSLGMLIKLGKLAQFSFWKEFRKTSTDYGLVLVVKK